MPTKPPADATPRQRLALLLLSLYAQDELRRAVLHFDDKHRTGLQHDLPGPAASARALAEALVAAMDHAQIHAFLDHVALDRPRRSHELDELRPLFPRPPADEPSN